MANDAASLSNLVVQQLDETAAREILVEAPQASWRQYPAYSAVAAREARAESRYLLVRSGDMPVALANVRIKRLPLVPTGLAMIAQGPVMLSDAPGAREWAIQALFQYVVEELGLTLRINPPVDFEKQAPVEGFSPVEASEYETFVIDLAPDLETLRKQLNGKWRTDLRRAEKSDITITHSSREADFLAFQPLLDELSEEKGFSVPQDARFFARVAAEAREPESIVIHLARHQGRVIGGHVGAFSGNMAVYLIGATNDEGRDLRASFLMQWSVIEFARSRGMKWYDLGGVNEAENPHVFRFKKRMGGRHYEGPPMLEARAKFPRGQIVNLAEKVYAKVKG